MIKTIKMKRFLIMVFSLSLMFANAQKEKESPLSFEASYIADNFYNAMGGIKTGYTYLGLIDLSVGFETGKAKLWSGGEFFIHGSNSHGGEPSGTFVGDLQGVSNIEAGNHTFLYELWYKQRVWSIDLIVGLQDLNAEFAASEYAGLFINGSFGIPSVIGHNTTAPIFPITALGATVLYHIKDNFTFKTSLFDGTTTDFDNNAYNLNWKLCREDGFSSYSELQFTTKLLKERTGTYLLGYFAHRHVNVQSEEDNTGENEQESKQGIYVIADQELFSKEDKSLAAFMQISYSPKDGGNNFLYVGAGIHYAGTFNRANDEVGVAIAHAQFEKVGAETTIECSYKVAMGESIFIQPNIQYIFNPGGNAALFDNALAAILRIGLSF